LAQQEFKRNWKVEPSLEELKAKFGEDASVRDNLVDLSNPRMLWNPTITELALYTDVRIFNVFSEHDMADKYLYPLGSIMEVGGPACAIGACELSEWHYTVAVSKSGEMIDTPDLKKSNVWNINASEVIYSHSDIYKGRVANLLWQILSLKLPKVSEEDLEADIDEEPVMGGNWWFQRDHRWVMKAVNRARRLSIKEKLERRRYNSLLFDLDQNMKQGQWDASKRGIQKLLQINYCTPGWWWQVNAGIVSPGTLIDRRYASITGGRVCSWPQLLLLHAVVSAKLNDCTEAVRYLNYYETEGIASGSQEILFYGDKLPKPYRFGSPEEFIGDICRLPPKDWQPYAPAK
jgi:hypothetical protein